MLKSNDGDYLILLVPVDGEGRLDKRGRVPWLFQGTWEGKSQLGEIRAQEQGIELHWSDGDVMDINLDAVPIRAGRVFSVDSSEGVFHYTVQDASLV